MPSPPLCLLTSRHTNLPFGIPQSVGRPRADGSTVAAQYYCSHDDAIIAGDVYMSKWLLRTENAVEHGAKHDLYKQGDCEGASEGERAASGRVGS